MFPNSLIRSATHEATRVQSFSYLWRMEPVFKGSMVPKCYIQYFSRKQSILVWYTQLSTNNNLRFLKLRICIRRVFHFQEVVGCRVLAPLEKNHSEYFTHWDLQTCSLGHVRKTITNFKSKFVFSTFPHHLLFQWRLLP